MKKRNGLVVILAGLLFCVILFSASLGASTLSMADSLWIILEKIPGIRNLVSFPNYKDVYVTIIWDIRMPRILLAGMVGGGLSVVGAVFQGIFRNPLADPHILGISSGAALGATIAMISGVGIQFLGLGVIGAAAFIFSLLTVFLVYQISRSGNQMSSTTIILTGTAVSTMLSAMISLLMSFHRDQIEKVYLWTLGSFSAATWTKVRFLAIFLLVMVVIMMLFSKELDMMTTGEETAGSLGVDTVKVRKILILVSSLLIAACVSVSGIIGFVGLVVPHSIRMLHGPKHKSLLPLSVLGGASFMILCDTLGRTLAAPSEIPVGVITAVAGTPFFIYLLRRNQRRVEGGSR